MKTETRKIRIQVNYPETILKYKNKSIEIGAGTNDDISLFYYDKEFTLVLVTNEKLGYMGAELINIKTMEKYFDMFFDNAKIIIEILNGKKNIWDYSLNTVADFFDNWLY